MAFVSLLGGSGPLADSPSSSIEIEVVRIDGTTASGTFDRLTTEDLAVTSDRRLVIPIEDLHWVRFLGRSPETPVDSNPSPSANAERENPVAEFFLGHGGRITGTIIGEGHDAVIVDTSVAKGVSLPFSSLAGVWLANDRTSRELQSSRSDIRASASVRAADPTSSDSAKDISPEWKLFEETLAARPVGQDILLTRHEGQSHTIRGSILNLGPKGGRFVFNGRERPFGWERVFAVVLARGVGDERPGPVTVQLLDGGTFTAHTMRGDRDRLIIDTAFGGELAVPLESLAGLEFVSPRVTYLSDLVPAGNTTTGLILEPEPAQFNRSVSNGPLSVGGRRFAKGIGVHARTELVYEPRGAFQALAATIGIDDAVRPRGSVVFKVVGDGAVLFDSGPVTGKDDPRDIVVDISGVGALSLIVEFGEDLDIADQADWADARLIRPPTQDRAADTPAERGAA